MTAGPSNIDNDSYAERAGDFVRSVGSGVKELTGGALDSFKKKMATWYRDFLVVKNDKRVLPADLEKKRSDLISNGEKIIYVAKSMGVELNQEYIQQNLGIAFVPVLLAVGAAGLLAMVAKWYYDDRDFKRAEKIYSGVIKSGGSHDDARQAVNVARPDSVFKGVGARTEGIATKLIIGGVVLGGIYFYLKNKGAL